MNIIANSNEVFLITYCDNVQECSENIGVCNSWDMAKEMIREYFDFDGVIISKDVRDSGIEFTAEIEVDGIPTFLSVHTYNINQV